MWVRMTRAVVAGRQPRQVGNVIQLSDQEAQILVLAGSAVLSNAPPSPPISQVETTEAPLPGVEHAVTRKRKSK